MSTLVVQAHPLEDSYNGVLLASVCRGLDSTGQAYTVRRLGEGQHPTIEDVASADKLAVVYPTWWSGPPAMLLDWLQQMLAARAFGAIAELRVVTTHGSSWLMNRTQGEWGRRFMAERMAAACGPGTQLEWHALYKIDRRTPDEIQAFLDETEGLFAASPLTAV